MLDNRSQQLRERNLKKVERSFKRTVAALCTLGITALGLTGCFPFRPLEDIALMAALVGGGYYLYRRFEKNGSWLQKNWREDFPAQKEEKLTRIAQDFAAKLDLPDQERYCVKIAPTIEGVNATISGTTIFFSEDLHRFFPLSAHILTIGHEIGHLDQEKHNVESREKEMTIERLQKAATLLSCTGFVLTCNLLMLGILAGTFMAARHHDRAREYNADAYYFLLNGIACKTPEHFLNSNPRTYTGFGKTWRDFKENPGLFLGFMDHPTARQRLNRLARYKKRALAS